MEDHKDAVSYSSTSKDFLKDSPDSPDEDCNSSDKYEPETKIIRSVIEPEMSTDSKFIMWDNDNANICWLDASMSLLVHNQTMRHVSKLNPDCQVSKIIKSYDEANSTLNNFISDQSNEEKLKVAKDILQKVQESSLKYLQPLVKCKKGEPDSAFCSLLNLIKEDKLIQGFFDVTYMWVKFCNNCEMQRVLTSTKPIITITHVGKFVPECHISPCQCHMCKKKDQTVKLLYKKLPACLIFHFENGAGEGNVLPQEFSVASREYHLTGVMMLEKAQESNINHFVTYIRDSSVDKWLECNDLNIEIVSFSDTHPVLDLKDVYICVYETFDNLGTIEIEEDPSLSSSDHNIPCIDLSDEEDSNKLKCPNKSKESGTEMNASAETVENIKAFLSASLEEDSNSNSKTSEIDPKNLNLAKSISDSHVNTENSVTEEDACLNDNHSKSKSVSKCVQETITLKAETDDDRIQEKKIKTPIDGYFNIDKFIESKLNEIKTAPNLGTSLPIALNTSLLKEDSSNSSSVSVEEGEKSLQVYGLFTNNVRGRDDQTGKETVEVEATKKKLPGVKKIKKKKRCVTFDMTPYEEVPIEQNISTKHDENNVIGALYSKVKSSNVEKRSENVLEKRQMANQKLVIKREVKAADPEESSGTDLQNVFEEKEKSQVELRPIVKPKHNEKFLKKTKNSKLLSKEIQSKQICNKNVVNSLLGDVSYNSKDSQSSKQIFVRLKECSKEEFAKQLNAKEVSGKFALDSNKEMVSRNSTSKEDISVKNILGDAFLDSNALMGIVEGVMNDSEISKLQESSQDKTTKSRNRPMMHHISVDSLMGNDETSFNMNQPSCSYSLPHLSKDFKPRKNKGFHVQFSDERNYELENHKIVKKFGRKKSKSVESSVIDTDAPRQKSTSSTLNFNSSPNKASKSVKVKKSLKVKMFPQFSRSKQTEEESDESLNLKTEGTFSDEDNYFLDSSPPKKRIKKESSNKSFTMPNPSFAENSTNGCVVSVNSNSCRSMCSKRNCQCYKIEKTTFLHCTVDYLLMQLFQTFPLECNPY